MRFDAIGAFDENDVYLSYLPAAHVMEQLCIGSCLMFGMKCGFFGGNPLKVLEDVGILKPTFFPAVPRVLTRVYSKI